MDEGCNVSNRLWIGQMVFVREVLHADIPAAIVLIVHELLRKEGYVLSGDASHPAIAGTAALVRSYYPELGAAAVARRLELTAAQLGVAVPNTEIGYGVIDPFEAVSQMLPAGARTTGSPDSAEAGIRLPRPRPPDTWPDTAAMAVCGLVALAVIAALACAHVTRTTRTLGGWTNSPG